MTTCKNQHKNKRN